MKKNTTWKDRYRGIDFSVSNWQLESTGDCWAYYIFLVLDQLPEDVRERFWLEPEPTEWKSMPIRYDYYSEPLISELDWHGGCTWYSKEGFEGNRRVVKIGCDYQHYWDEGRHYNLDFVADEARHTIDTLHELIPGIMKWCCYCGDYFVPEADERRCPECKDK